MNLKTFQQSELKRFDEEFNSDETHNAGREKFIEFIKSSIEKAYSLGKEEREYVEVVNVYTRKPKKKVKKDEILAGLPRKMKVNKKALGLTAHDFTLIGWNACIDQITNLLKNK